MCVYEKTKYTYVYMTKYVCILIETVLTSRIFEINKID